MIENKIIASPQLPGVTRHYFRCIDCLTPFCATLETNKNTPGHAAPQGTECQCGNATAFEYMGKVRGRFYTKTETVTDCQCNQICAHARGPNCECDCGGSNHGLGVMLVLKETARGKVREARATKKAVAHSEWYRAKVAELTEALRFHDQWNRKYYLKFFADCRTYATREKYAKYLCELLEKEKRK